MDWQLRELAEQIIESVMDKVEVTFSGCFEPAPDYEIELLDYQMLVNEIGRAIEDYCERKLEAAKS